MKLSTRLIIVGLVAAVLLSMTGLKGAAAQSALTDDQLQKISANCLSIKNSLNQLHVSDALLRVNRGQIYDSMGSKLMDRFNSRLNSNGQDSTGTTLVTSSYKAALDTFRADYIAYEHQLTTAINVDCDKQPLAFHNALDDARTKRNKVHTDVLRLHQYIDDYRSAVSDFLINFERVTGEK